MNLSKESAQVILNVLAQVQLTPGEGAVEAMTALTKAQKEVAAIANDAGLPRAIRRASKAAQKD